MAIDAATHRHRHLMRAGIAVLALVVVAGCSSDAEKSDAKDKKKPAVESSTSSSSVASSSSTSTPSAAPCNLDAATAALSAESATAATIVCGNGWAAGAAASPGYDLAYLLHDVDGNWTNEGTDSAEMGEACAPGNPLGIPEKVLATSPCKVS